MAEEDYEEPVEPVETVEEPVEEEVETEEIEEPEEHEEEPKLSRAESRIQKLANERAEAIARAESAEREREFYRQQVQPQEDLDPDEKWRRQTEIAVKQALAQASDNNDRGLFLSKMSQNPVYQKYASKVEEELTQARKSGFSPTREQVLVVLLGRQALESQSKVPKQKQQAADRVRDSRGASPGVKTNVNVSSSKSEREQREARLKDMPL